VPSGDNAAAQTGKSRGVYIASIASTVPPYCADQASVAELLRKHFGHELTPRSLALMRVVFSHPGIRKRHFAIDDPACVFDEPPDKRVARFTEKSVQLAGQAVTRALAEAGVGMQEVSGVIVNTCTGYICPGISSYLMERLGLARNIRVYDMVGSGCGGAIPNLQMAEAMLKGGESKVVVSVSVEVCSAAFQMGNDVSLILSNALFGDGAAAAVLWREPVGFEVVASTGRYVPALRDEIRFVYKEGKLHNQLSPRLPELVGEVALEVVTDLLTGQRLNRADIAHWALHTGGERIISVVRDRIGIPEERLGATRRTLAEYGNMSSPTVWFVLKEIEREGIEAGELCIMITYGAGLSAHACLLRKT